MPDDRANSLTREFLSAPSTKFAKLFASVLVDDRARRAPTQNRTTETSELPEDEEGDDDRLERRGELKKKNANGG